MKKEINEIIFIIVNVFIYMFCEEEGISKKRNLRIDVKNSNNSMCK